MTELMRQVEALRAAERQAREKVAEMDAARRDGARRVAQAHAELTEFWRRQGRGEVSEDDPTEAALQAAVIEAGGGVPPTLKPVHYPAGETSEVVLESVNEKAEQNYAGAVEMLEQREAELRQFVAANHSDIEVERAPIAASIRDQMASVILEARGIADAWEQFRAATAELASLGGRAELIEEFPDNPLRWLAEVEDPVPLPMPESFIG
jgi:hypothetical protein